MKQESKREFVEKLLYFFPALFFFEIYSKVEIKDWISPEIHLENLGELENSKQPRVKNISRGEMYIYTYGFREGDYSFWSSGLGQYATGCSGVRWIVI